MKKIVVVDWFIEPFDVPSNQRIFEHIMDVKRGSCPDEEKVPVSKPKPRTALVYRVDEALKESFKKNRRDFDFQVIALLSDGTYVDEESLTELKKPKSPEAARLLKQAEGQKQAQELRSRLKSGL